jgi:hypothetical protein
MLTHPEVHALLAFVVQSRKIVNNGASSPPRIEEFLPKAAQFPLDLVHLNALVEQQICNLVVFHRSLLAGCLMA